MAALVTAAEGGKTVEVDGIRVTVDIDPANDYELAECSLVMNDPDSTQEERSRALVREFRLVLGGDYGRVMRELREARGGRLPSEDVVSFVNRVISEVTTAKN